MLRHRSPRVNLLYDTTLDRERLDPYKRRGLPPYKQLVLSPQLVARLKAAVDRISFPADILSNPSNSQKWTLPWLPDELVLSHFVETEDETLEVASTSSYRETLKRYGRECVDVLPIRGTFL